MSAHAAELDLQALRLAPGEGRRLELPVPVEPIELAGESYQVNPRPLEVALEVSRMVGHGYALHALFEARLCGPCMRCLKDASPSLEVEAREVHVPGAGEELESPYVEREILDLAAWTRDALVLAIPTRVLCRPDCAGLCPECAADLNEARRAGLDHRHEHPLEQRPPRLSGLEL